MIFSRFARVEPRKAKGGDPESELSRITLEFSPVKSTGLRVESADVAHNVEPSPAERDALKREALEDASTPTPA
jgi:hypothetical protein